MRIIQNCIVPENSRIELTKDLAMLSFYLCGMNAVDLYQLEETKYLPSRIDYNRSKTDSLREDNAFMSVKLPAVAEELYRKYAGKLRRRYSTHICLDQAISKGMVGLCKLTNIPDLDFYDLRHAFADIARNTLGFNKDDIKEVLNHKNSSDVTDIYLSRSWGIMITFNQMSLLIFSLEQKIKRHVNFREDNGSAGQNYTFKLKMVRKLALLISHDGKNNLLCNKLSHLRRFSKD